MGGGGTLSLFPCFVWVGRWNTGYCSKFAGFIDLVFFGNWMDVYYIYDIYVYVLLGGERLDTWVCILFVGFGIF